MSCADLMKTERKKRGWSQEQLAKKLHISRSMVGKYERNEKVFDLTFLASISKVFGFSFISCIGADETRIYRLKERRFLQLLRQNKAIYKNVMDYPQQALEKLENSLLYFEEST